MADQAQMDGGGAPYAILLCVVVGIVVGAPFLLGDSGEAITSAFSDLLSPAGLLFLPVALLILIRFLSSDRGAAFSDLFSCFGGPDSIHRLGGSPVGIALLLVVLLFLLYNRVSLFGGGDDEE